MKTKNLEAEITRRNKLFKGKTRAEKRVLIAQDVIAQIKAKTLIPSSGTWVRLENADFLLDSDSLRAVTLNKDTTCKCCALGGLFLSCTLFNNKVTVGDVTEGDYGYLDDVIRNGEKFSNGLNTIFSENQLKLIENAFEQGGGAFDPAYENFSDKYNALTSEAIRFGKRFSSDKNRLIAIMNNIIKNNGTFVP